nr:unnamed protein product [Callosobruchus analis]
MGITGRIPNLISEYVVSLLTCLPTSLNISTQHLREILSCRTLSGRNLIQNVYSIWT